MGFLRYNSESNYLWFHPWREYIFCYHWNFCSIGLFWTGFFNSMREKFRQEFFWRNLVIIITKKLDMWLWARFFMFANVRMNKVKVYSFINAFLTVPSVFEWFLIIMELYCLQNNNILFLFIFFLSQMCLWSTAIF